MIANPLEWILETVLSRAFAQAMAVVVLLYVLLMGFLALQAGDILQKHESTLGHKIVKISRQAPMAGAHEQSAPAPVSEHTIATVPAEPPGPAVEAGTDESIISAAPAIPLPPAPIEGLYEKTEAGLLPVPNKQGLTPFEAYKRPHHDQSTAALSILISDFGLSETLSRQLSAELPPEVSFALSPYANNPEEWQKLARSQGHEIWMTVPMETQSFSRSDPGPKALLSLAMLADNQKNLAWAMARATGYAGVALELDDTFKNAIPVFQSLLKSTLTRGVGYLDLNPAAPNMARQYATESGAPYARAAFFVDHLSEDVMALAADRAKTQGLTIVALKPSPAQVETLKRWIQQLKKDKIALAPVSARIRSPKPATATTSAPHE